MSEWILVEKVEDVPSFLLEKMAYPFMLIATALMWSQFESLQNVIPGHLILSFLIVECGAMVLTFLIMKLTLIGAAFSALGCMFILGFVFRMIVGAIKPDSVQYFVLVTVIFSVISFVLCYLNLTHNSGSMDIPGLSCIVAGILNALTAALYILIIRGAWEDYRFPEGGFVVEDKILYNSIVGDIFGSPRGFASTPGAVAFYIVFAVICLGAFVTTIIFRDSLT